MKRFTFRMAALLLCLTALPWCAWADTMLVPVGRVVGLEIGDDRVVVAAYDDAIGGRARQAGLEIGDEILEIDGVRIDSAEDVRKILTRSDGAVELLVCRDGKERTLHLSPCITGDGPKLGVYLRCGITGIGTVTYYDPDTGAFGTLGHAVSNGSGQTVDLVKGSVYRASVLSVKRGMSGEPGQLRGAFSSDDPIGVLWSNTSRGVFGRVDIPWEGEAVPTADRDDVKTGVAMIRSTVAGDAVRDYSVEIVKIYPGDRADGRNLLLRVTDPALLEATGGIVQGMSGSPIIQDGKLIGAVTHVLVNDPTTGYGIFIENMLDAAA